MSPKHYVSTENAASIWRWLQLRGGLFLWNSVDLSDLNKSWTSPATKIDGTPTTQPHWKADTTPYRHIIDAADVFVETIVEVKRFHVAVRMGGQGMMLKCTSGSSRRIEKELVKAGEGASYQFDYGMQEAVIYKPSERVPITEYILRHIGDF